MAKTKNISLRLNEDDLALAIKKSGIEKTQKLIDFILTQYVQSQKLFESVNILGYEFPVKKIEAMETAVLIPSKKTEGVPNFKNDIERKFWEEKQKLKK